MSNNTDKHIEDHEGNSFRNVLEMCNYWDTEPATFYKRREKGWSLCECLQGKLDIVDHKGIRYHSIKEMCEHYGVRSSTYKARISRGMSVEDALTKKTVSSDSLRSLNEQIRAGVVVDHLGNIFSDVNEMCEHYNIKYTTFMQRIRRGLPVRVALKA